MTALVFPGQGSQFIGMAKDFHDEFLVAKETFEIIENSVKINLRDIIFNNKSELLNFYFFENNFFFLKIFCLCIG